MCFLLSQHLLGKYYLVGNSHRPLFKIAILNMRLASPSTEISRSPLPPSRFQSRHDRMCHKERDGCVGNEWGSHMPTFKNIKFNPRAVFHSHYRPMTSESLPPYLLAFMSLSSSQLRGRDWLIVDHLLPPIHPSREMYSQKEVAQWFVMFKILNLNSLQVSVHLYEYIN